MPPRERATMTMRSETSSVKQYGMAKPFPTAVLWMFSRDLSPPRFQLTLSISVAAGRRLPRAFSAEIRSASVGVENHDVRFR